MILDAQNLFSDAQAVTAAAGSTNILDLGPLQGTVRDIGVGKSIYLFVLVDTAFTDAGSDSTLTVTVETDADVAFGSPTLAVQTVGTFPALSAIGAKLAVKLQPFAITERYMRVFYTPNNGNLTTGAVTAFLALGIDAYRAYADNITIS